MEGVEEPDMPYEDGDYTFFLYAYGTKDITSQELKDMLLFLVDSSEENAKMRISGLCGR